MSLAPRRHCRVRVGEPDHEPVDATAIEPTFKSLIAVTTGGVMLTGGGVSIGAPEGG